MGALEALDGEEAEAVRHLIEEHAMRTDSPKAHELLDHWQAVLGKMVKCMPSEYKRIFAERATMPETAGRTALVEAPRPYVPSGAYERVAEATSPRRAHG